MLISVYIASYNQKHYLSEAIQSVVNQTLRPYEIIIVDDCSTDDSQGVIRDYACQYPGWIIPIYHTKNQGIGQTRVDALRAVKGDYVTYVDGDDRLLPTKLEREAKLLEENPNVQIAFSNYYYISPNGSRTGVWADNEIPPQGNVFSQAFARDFPNDALFRNELVVRSCFSEVGSYDDSLLIYEDWDMKIRLTKCFRTAYCPEPLAEYRNNPDGLSRLPASLHLESVRKIYKKNRSLLAELSKDDRILVEKALSTKFAQLSRQAVVDEIKAGRRNRALEYWLQYLQYNPRGLDPRLPARIILPLQLYSGLRAVYRGLRGVHT